MGDPPSAVPECQYCKCRTITSLVKCPATGLYFCNGRGGLPQTHIIHYLRSLHFDQISLPRGNPFSNVQIKCYVCRCTDLFKLGFVPNADRSRVFLVCRHPCQFSDVILTQDGVRPDSFEPLVSHGAVHSDLVPAPPPDDCPPMSVAEARTICAAIRSKLPGARPHSAHARPEFRAAQMSYSSKAEFREIMAQFLSLEQRHENWAHSHRFYSGISGRWIDERTFAFRPPIPLYKACSVSAQVSLSLDRAAADGVVTRRRRQLLHIRFEKKPTFGGESGGFRLQLCPNDLGFRRQTRSLEAFVKRKDTMHEVIKDVFLGRMDRFDQRNRCPELVFSAPRIEGFPQLNPSQVLAATIAIQSRFSMIHGPPGTGKTTVIAALAHSFVEQNEKVLVVAHTNVATDLLTLVIASTGIRPVRVFALHFDEPDPAVAPFESIDRDSILRAPVVVTTTGCIAGARFRGITFRKVIVDEASQCLDPELLQAVVHGCDQLVLVGDHNQIGPMVVHPASRRLKFNTPLMHRTVLNGKRPEILNMQYRMHPAISAFASRTFYRGLLHDGPVKRPVPEIGFTWPNPDVPLFFWNIESADEYAGSGTSLVNTGEATAISELLRRFAGRRADPTGIAVITPYLGQVAYLYDALQVLCDPKFVNDVEIDTVDAFQGREKDFVIFGCVRANEQREIGFLADEKRMNVALTRAKLGMIVVGTAAVFAKNDLWAAFVEYCQSLNAFVDGPIDEWKPATFQREEPDGSASDHDDDLA